MFLAPTLQLWPKKLLQPHLEMLFFILETVSSSARSDSFPTQIYLLQETSSKPTGWLFTSTSDQQKIDCWRYTHAWRQKLNSQAFRLQNVSKILSFGSVGSLKLELPVGSLVVPDDYFQVEIISIYLNLKQALGFYKLFWWCQRSYCSNFWIRYVEVWMSMQSVVVNHRRFSKWGYEDSQRCSNVICRQGHLCSDNRWLWVWLSLIFFRSKIRNEGRN
jgi:hypothetical protein